ncbi:MAG: sulfite exporter TauE/SafE family protein [Firmicutes bacterium]|jgi:hypothetical protein|nr:sulfite exporter TauE/SafE family protein [Bacillota bacterium]
MTVALLAFLAGVLLGMGGTGANALLVPLLNLFSGLKLSKIITAGILSSAFLKPATAALHTRGKKLNSGIIRFLLLGSLPAALLGTWVFSKIINEKAFHAYWNYAFAVLLSVCAAALMASIYKTSVYQNRRLYTEYRDASRVAGKNPTRGHPSSQTFGQTRRWLPLSSVYRGVRGAEVQENADGFSGVSAYKKVAVLILGIASGFLFGLTSIGSGSLTVSFLSLIFPEMSSQDLVAIDLLQAAPLAIFAAAGQLWFASFDMELFLLLTLMGIPGMICGWMLSRKMSNRILKVAIAITIWMVSVEYAYKSGGPALLLLPATVLFIFATLFRRQQISTRRKEEKILLFSASQSWLSDKL